MLVLRFGNQHEPLPFLVIFILVSLRHLYLGTSDETIVLAVILELYLRKATSCDSKSRS